MVKMKTIEDKIIHLLSSRSYRIEELSQLLDRSPGCIRGTLSRMRKKGLIDCSIELYRDNRFKVVRLSNKSLK